MFNNSYPTQNYGGYSYLPEMQGMTDIQNRQYINNMNTQVGNLNNAGARSNLQSSGSFLANRAKLGSQTAQGQQDIASQNMYKNALFALQDRRTREQRDYSKEMADKNFQQQMQMYKTKLADSQEQMLQQSVGGGLGMLGSKALNYLMPASNGMDAIMSLLGGGSSSGYGQANNGSPFGKWNINPGPGE